MSRMACVENIYDALVAAGLNPEHACFDDLVMGCSTAAVDPTAKGKEVVEIIADLDADRDEIMVALDIKEFFTASGCKAFVTDVIAKAVAAGKAGWNQH